MSTSTVGLGHTSQGPAKVKRCHYPSTSTFRGTKNFRKWGFVTMNLPNTETDLCQLSSESENIYNYSERIVRFLYLKSKERIT